MEDKNSDLAGPVFFTAGDLNAGILPGLSREGRAYRVELAGYIEHLLKERIVDIMA